MKKLFFVITLFISLAAQAQTYSPFLSDGDTITIRQGENYLAASNGLQRYTIANSNCLWKITITKGSTTIGSSTYYYKLQNIATQQYIQIEAGYRFGWGGGAYADISLGSNDATAATLYLIRNDGADGIFAKGRLLYRYTRNRTNYDFYLTYNNGWTMQQGTTDDLYLEKWTRKEVQAIDGYFTPRKHEFSLAKTDAEAGEQVLSNVRYVFDLRDSAYLYCKNRPTAPKLQLTVEVESDLTKLQAEPYYITPSFAWESSRTANSQLDPEKFAATDNETTPRDLLSVEPTGNISSDKLAYELSITPVGPSPKGLKNPLRGNVEDLIWVDYVDRLVATCTYKGKEYTSTMRVVRKSYHREELPQFEFTLSPSTYTFTATENLTQYFTINCTHQHGEVWYNIDEQKVDIVPSYGPAPVELPTYSGTPSGQTITWSNEEKTVTLSLKELNSDNPATWLSFTAINGNTITLTAQPNNANNSTYRQARLVGEITYNKWFDQTEHSHAGSFSRIIAQRSNSGNYITFAHSKGYPYDGDKPTEVTIEQQVHTAEKIIYHLSGEPVELRLPENNFFGYMRWYDYESGGNPRYNNGTNYPKTTWALVPRANGTNFLEINTADGQSHGLYATADEGLDSRNRNNNTPIIYGWTDDNPHTMACDVSAYRDYDITYNNGQKTKIVEPTLSYRQLFHLRPASEIADKFNTLDDAHEFIENYRYQAPVGRIVLLATQHRHSNYRYHISEMCYFYYDNSNPSQIKRVNAESGGTKLTWYVKDGDCSEQANLDGFTELSPNYPAEIDYQQVESDVKGTKTYRLMAMAGDNSDDLAYNLHIAQFVVEYVDIHTHGPSTTELISDNEITQNYVSLTKVDFNKTKPTSSSTEYLSTPLPWQDATYGFTYPGAKPTYNRHVNTDFPFYGEYCFVNKINTTAQNWLKAETNRGGAANGFAMYVDGTMEPGIVATISTNATICSGQTLYCSAWFCNPATDANKTRPIFRCNVQGRKKDVDGTWQDWEDAGVYFVGEIQNTGWQQIKFPINSAQSYDETRVMIYNFATTNQGNDFMIDDINLFVSPLPIAAYQGKMACRSMSSDVATSAAVLRLDYSNLTEDEDKYIYYQIFNDSEDKAMVFDDDEDEGVTYFHENQEDNQANNTDNRYGSVRIPSGDFNPEADNTDNKNNVYPSLSKFLDHMVEKNMVNGKCYVKTTNYGVTKWLLYVVHLIPNEAPHNDQVATIDDDEYDRSEELKANKEYTMRMAHTPAELDKPSCNMQTSLTAVHQTMFQLRNPSGDVGESFYATSDDNCANQLYMLDVEISNTYAERLGDESQNTATGLVYADWLKGFKFDEVYADKSTASEEALSNANSAFETQYGHKRGEVATAILYDMRRIPSKSEPNPNYYAKSFEELKPESFLSHKNYDIVKDLYEKGYLQFYQTTDTFYLASQDTARFWVYPISGTATATVEYNEKDTTLVLHDCPEPRWVEVSSKFSNQNLNITSYTQAQLKQQGLSHQLPRIKVVANQTSPVSLTIDESVTDININATLFSTNDPQCTNTSQVTATVTKSNNTLQITPSGSLRPGYEYILSVAAQTSDGDGCTSTLYFTLVVVPEVVVWKPKSNEYNGWGMDANWKGWVDDGDGIVEDAELTKGYIPIQGVNVVIPSMEHDLRYPSVTDHHHHPMDLNASSSTCNYIYFAPGAKIHNQHLLQYRKAFVDMQMTAGSWHLVSAPLQSMVSGDMFIPHNGLYNEEQNNRIAEPNPFEVKAFEGTDYQGIRHADAAYAFWEAFHESDVNGSNTLVRNFSNMKFTQSNSLEQPLNVGTGYMVYGLGHQEAEQLTVRLPKPDTRYYYYNEGNKDESSYVDITETNRGKLAYKVEESEMTIELKKQANSNYVVFGNPTMAYIDLLALYNDNKEQGWTGEYTYVQHSATAARTPMLNTPDRYLPPMTSVLLTTTDQATELTIHLKPEHLTLNTEVDRSMNGETPSQLAARRAPISDNAVSELMTINAFTEKAFASMILATNPTANDYYTSGEDALFTSTGVENESYVTTPLNMYTVAEQVPMMADVRQGISEIPLAILAVDKARAEHMQLAFYLSPNWSRECYFYDSQTGQRIRIMDGLVITVEMPQNHEQRYYIEGPDEYLGDSNDDGTTTATYNVTSNSSATLSAYSLAQGELCVSSNLLIRQVKLYDLTGRLIVDKPLQLLNTTTTLAAPSGICLVEAILRDGTTLHTQSLVK